MLLLANAQNKKPRLKPQALRALLKTPLVSEMRSKWSGKAQRTLVREHFPRLHLQASSPPEGFLEVPLRLKPFYCLLPIACCLLLSACDFQPVYSKTSSLSAQSPINAGVKISASAGSAVSTSGNGNSSINSSASSSTSRQFTNNLEDLLGSSTAPEYKLDVSISESSVGIGVARDGTASRYNLVINSSYKLIRIADNKEVDSGSLSNFTSYNNPNNQYFSTYISEKDARKRGIAELAELYRQRLIAFVEKTQLPTPPLSTPPPLYENCPKSS